ncbi:hypothetical protein DYB32_008366 [Aphanomyces invadans]|uniref:Sulfhydryl oxidase n=1 Tax=Aphanomyces invadans TaxID=157072 RepID=A0A3R7CYN1_9STRA|nr:hypothetical protein DYB32_008366 [Aphanomyces invadans]
MAAGAAAMLSLVLSGIPSVAAFWGNTAPLFEDSQTIRSFTSDDFASGVLASDVAWVVDFYAPWCPHCRHFAPHYEAVADHYGESTTVKYGAVDCTVEDKLCTDYQIMGYPSLLLFNVPAKGSKPMPMPFRFRGKTFEGVVTWVEEVLTSQNMSTGVDLPDFRMYKEIGYGGTAPPKKFPNLRSAVVRITQHIVHTSITNAGHALASSLETGMFLGSSVLASTKYDTVEKWLRLLVARFPLEANRQALATLLYRVQSQRTWTLAEWKVLIATWKLDVFGDTYPRDLFSRKEMELCTTYTCGLWTLFHGLTVPQSTATSPLSAAEAAAVAFGIRDFVVNFFGCETCVQHFTAANPDAKLQDIGLHGAPDDELILWLHAMHNSVNARTNHSNFPMAANCPACYSQPTADLAVVQYLKNEYSVLETDKFVDDSSALEDRVADDANVSASMLFVGSVDHVEVSSVVLMTAFVFAVYVRYGRREIKPQLYSDDDGSKSA